MINFMLNILMYKYKGAILRYEDPEKIHIGKPNYYIFYNNMKFTPFNDSNEQEILLTNIPDLYFKYRNTRAIRFLPLYYLFTEKIVHFVKNDILIDPLSITAQYRSKPMRFHKDVKKIVFNKPIYFADTKDYTFMFSSGPKFLSNYFQPIKTSSIFNVHGENIFACFIDGVERPASSLLLRINIQKNYNYNIITFNNNEYKSVLELISFLVDRELANDEQYTSLYIDNNLIKSLSKYYKAFVDCINLDEDIFVDTNNINEIGGLINEYLPV